MRNKILTVAVIAVIAIICFIPLMKCTGEKEKPILTGNDSMIQSMIDSKNAVINTLLAKIGAKDSIISKGKDTVVVYRTRLVRAKDNAIAQAPDTCRPYIDSVYAACHRLDSTNQVVIRNQDTTINSYVVSVNNYQDVVRMIRYQMQQKRDSIAAYQEINRDLSKQNKKEVRNGNLKTAGGTLLGVLLGVITGRAVP